MERKIISKKNSLEERVITNNKKNTNSKKEKRIKTSFAYSIPIYPIHYAYKLTNDSIDQTQRYKISLL